MGERDKPHSYRMSPQSRWKLLTHSHGDEDLDGEVDEEVQPGMETESRSSHGAAAARGDAAAAALGPPSILEMVLVWRRSSGPRRLPRRRKIRGFWWLSPKLGFPLFI